MRICFLLIKIYGVCKCRINGVKDIFEVVCCGRIYYIKFLLSKFVIKLIVVFDFLFMVVWWFFVVFFLL